MEYINEEEVKELATSVNRVAELVAITTAKQFQKQIDQLQDENASLKQDLDLHDILISTYKAEIAQLKVENKHLREALSEYGTHVSNCCHHCGTPTEGKIIGMVGGKIVREMCQACRDYIGSPAAQQEGATMKNRREMEKKYKALRSK